MSDIEYPFDWEDKTKEEKIEDEDAPASTNETKPDTQDESPFIEYMKKEVLRMIQEVDRYQPSTPTEYKRRRMFETRFKATIKAANQGAISQVEYVTMSYRQLRTYLYPQDALADAQMEERAKAEAEARKEQDAQEPSKPDGPGQEEGGEQGQEEGGEQGEDDPFTFHAPERGESEEEKQGQEAEEPTTAEEEPPMSEPATQEAPKHKQVSILRALVRNDVPVWMTGPAGSGKSHAAKSVAEEMGFPFYCISVCSQTPVSVLLGYMDATGKYVRTLFREAYEHGGVFLLDEVDAGNPNVLSVLNAALSVAFCAFPDGMVTKHRDFRILAAGNTYGNGASREYVGRLQIDAATIDRFVSLDWEYDETLERKLTDNPRWADRVQLIRKKTQELGIRHVVSTRAIINGAKALKAGLPLAVVEQMAVYKGLQTDALNKLKSAVGDPVARPTPNNSGQWQVVANRPGMR